MQAAQESKQNKTLIYIWNGRGRNGRKRTSQYV